MTTATANPKSVEYAGPGEYDAFLHGQYIGSFPSEMHAWTELNRVYLGQVEHGIAPELPQTGTFASDPPETDTATPDDEPDTALPVPAAELEAAATRLRPDPAIRKARTRLLEGDWSYQDDDALVIRFAPRSKGRTGKPSKPYTTTRDSCTCPGAMIRGGCYHPIAWEIVNEALSPTTTIQCHVPSAVFLPLCLLALSAGAEQVTLSAESARGSITFGTDGATGTVSVELTTPVLLTIEQQVCAADLKRVVDALAGALPPAGDQLLLDISDGSVLFMAGPEAAPSFFDGLDTLPLHEERQPTI